MDRLFLMSGQPMTTSNGAIQELNQKGVQLFDLCMRVKGYRSAGTVTVPNRS
jgi:hypothetical protein